MIQLAISILLFTIGAAEPADPGAADPGCDPQAYREVVEEIIRTDQQYRTAISWGTTDEAELARLEALPDDEQMEEHVRRSREGIKLKSELEKKLWAKQIAIDRANTRSLMDWVRACGWPSEELLGEGTPSMVPVLIHMQMEDAEWVLPVLREEVLAGRMPPRPYAMIFDRKQHHEGKPQIYGMTQAYDSKTRTVLPPAIVDLDATNAARAEIGMDPIEEYRITDEATAAGR
ncbi:MAG: DUF6624 domain-containing protein [Phycisphaerales bacterium]